MTLLLGDCIEQMRTLPDASVDMVLCDPPYGTTACKWDTVIPFAPMWAELKRVAKKNAAICLFGSEPFSSALRNSNIQRFKYDWIWVKERGTGIGNAKRMPLKRHEIVSVFYDSPPRYDYVGEKLQRPYVHVLPNTDNGTGGLNGAKSQGLTVDRPYHTYTHKTKQSVLEFKRDNVHRGRSLHPTQKPVALLEYLVRTYTLPGERVLDFTMGSGSTGVACVNTGRDFVGIELDANYFAIAQSRISVAEAAKAPQPEDAA